MACINNGLIRQMDGGKKSAIQNQTILIGSRGLLNQQKAVPCIRKYAKVTQKAYKKSKILKK